MSWLPYVGAGPGWTSPAKTPIPTAANPYLEPVAETEQEAEQKTVLAQGLAQTAAASHAQYDAAYVAIDAALAAWSKVRALADKIAKTNEWKGTDEQHTMWMHEAQLSLPGIAAAIAQNRAQLTALHGALSSDQALHRPDLGPAPAPESSGGGGLLLLAAGVTFIYALARWVF